MASILLAILSHSRAGAAPAPPLLGLVGGEYTILRPGTGEVLGHAHYTFERAGADEILRGEDRYLDGEYDIETDHLEPSVPSGAPILTAYKHWYYAPGGAPLMSVGLDVKSGMGLCVHYHGGQAETQSQSLSFPADTYAGASLLIPACVRPAQESGRSNQRALFYLRPRPAIARHPGQNARRDAMGTL